MKLNELQDHRIINKDRKRVGRGIGSGTGKTCGAGHKGQRARAGVSVNGFEGGQTPIFIRLPKRGFKNIFRIEYQKINIAKLQAFVDAGKINKSKEIDINLLYDIGFVNSKRLPIKILSVGDLKQPLNVVADAASAKAVDKFKAAGGDIKIISKKKSK